MSRAASDGDSRTGAARTTDKFVNDSSRWNIGIYAEMSKSR
jgi:hypothetical protein